MRLDDPVHAIFGKLKIILIVDFKSYILEDNDCNLINIQLAETRKCVTSVFHSKEVRHAPIAVTTLLRSKYSNPLSARQPFAAVAAAAAFHKGRNISSPRKKN